MLRSSTFHRLVSLSLALFLGVGAVRATEESSVKDPVLLIFSYPSVGRVYVSALYDYETNQTYLPVSELFTLLDIAHRRGTNRNRIEGVFLTNGRPYSLAFDQLSVDIGGKRSEFTRAQMVQGETDHFMTPEVYEQVFGMTFKININALTLTLESADVMPIVERKQREAARQRIESARTQRVMYPLTHGRDRAFIRMGVVDYSVTLASVLNTFDQNASYQTVSGMEVLGGDLQFSHSGLYSPQGTFMTQTGNVRWQYAVLDNIYLSRIEAGQISTRGPNSRAIRGVSLTNDPIESRDLYGTYVLDGRTEPDSEIELYQNNQLVSYLRADQVGYYRFEVPLLYGTTSLRTRIYTPNGDLIENDRQIQVPFVFLPRGVAAYSIQAGQIAASFDERTEGEIAAHGKFGIGLTKWLTANVGAEYSTFGGEAPKMYTSASARLFDSYLVNVDAVPNGFVRTQTSVVFPTSQSISLNHTWFDGTTEYNTRGAQQQIQVNVYTPLPFRKLGAGFRLGADHIVYPFRQETALNSDLFFRAGPVSLRLNHRENLVTIGRDIDPTSGFLAISGTYTIPRNADLPQWLRGSFVRGAAQYDRQLGQFKQVDAQLTSTINRTGRLSVGVSHQLQSGLSSIQIGFNMDLGGKMRSSTDFRSSAGTHSARQSLRGSIGYDDTFNRVQFTDRQLVGRSAVSVLLYVDANNSGSYEKDADEVIPYAAVRLDRASAATVGKDGVVRITQLQSYYRYNVEVNRRAIPNPLLVPNLDKFSMVSDPNQYKRIEIPFYRSGVIDGTVSVLKNNQPEGQGGLRMNLVGRTNGYRQEIRTFMGGGFFAMDIPPGRYTLEMDPAQLAFMGVAVRGGTTEIEIRSVAEGDYQGGIEILLEPDLAVPDEVVSEDAMIDRWHEEFKQRVDKAIALFIDAQDAAQDGDLFKAMTLIDQSLAQAVTDYGLALKGTIYHLSGDPANAELFWKQAIDRNPFISIPERNR